MSDRSGIERHFSPPEIATALHVDADTVRGWIKSGQLRARKLGNGRKRPRHRVPESALEAFLKTRETNAPKPRKRSRRSSGVIEYF